VSAEERLMLRTEADLLRTLRDGVYRLDELYAMCEDHADVDRDGGRDAIARHAADRRWKRRVRGVLQNLKASGRAERVERGVWALRGTRERPQRLMLIVAEGRPRDFELRLATAVELLGDLDEPADLVVADPPYGLGRGTQAATAERIYEADRTRVIDGYVDVDVDEYARFTHAWVAAAADALRPAGQLAVITGPQRAAVVQSAAEASGLAWVASIAARRTFAIRMTRRPSPSHWVVSVLTRGRVKDRRRVFHAPADLPAARSGVDYPLDLWLENGRSDRPGLLRYDNALPLRFVQRIVEAFSDPGEHVVDPFVGGGSSAEACWLAGRRFTGGDVNPHALRYTAARLLCERIWVDHQRPALFDRAA
jgi:DNA modification methylase